MRLLPFRNPLFRLLQEPPPDYLFEISETGVAHARRGRDSQIGFTPLAAGVLAVSPLQDNVLQPDVLATAVRSLAPTSNGHKHRRAALILPDYCARVAVLDFDAFPSVVAEQLALIRFRIRKTVPFDIDSAVIQHYVQPRYGQRFDVVIGVIAMGIVARYEAPFRAAGFHPGLVTTSSLAALGMLPEPEDARRGVRLMAKLCGRVLSVAVLEGTVLKVLRCVELSEVSDREVFSILYPTIAYVEDSLAAQASVLFLCGFDAVDAQRCAGWQSELGVPIERLASRHGTPGQHRAGLFGLIDSLEAF
jgi:type IV pilus assembly protein PilM